jgi:RNA polymerase sigma-70 factor (ECF subfamily)
MSIDVQQFEEQRPLLFGIAYRMLGSASEAEDVVQDAYLRATGEATTIRTPRAFLSTVVTRLCLDRLKAARTVREQYIGPWLPEPFLQQPADGAGEDQAERAETVSMAMLMLMEQLSPAERAVFLLHGAFEFSFAEVGAMIGRSPVACRQIYHRARAHLDARRPRFRPPPEQQRRLVEAFLTAARDGNLDGLTAMLIEQATYIGDGGGIVAAARRPVVGAAAVARLMAGLTARAAQDAPDMRFTLAWINTEPGLLVWEGDRLTTAMIFSCTGRHIAAIHAIRNPAKLTHLAARIAPSTDAPPHGSTH